MLTLMNFFRQLELPEKLNFGGHTLEAANSNVESNTNDKVEVYWKNTKRHQSVDAEGRLGRRRLVSAGVL